MYQLKFAIITPALITGAFAERIRFNSYIIFLVLFSILYSRRLRTQPGTPMVFWPNWAC
jgi:ammonia channel protein AmtB